MRIKWIPLTDAMMCGFVSADGSACPNPAAFAGEHVVHAKRVGRFQAAMLMFACEAHCGD